MNIIGKRFGRLTVKVLIGKDRHRNLLWSCKCDCGGQTITRTNSLNMGLVKSCGCLVRDIGERKTESHNLMWKGDKVGLGALHIWIKSRKPKTLVCERCFKGEPYDLANISGEYTRKLKDYKWLCRKCHMELDGRMERRKNNGQFKRTGIPECRIDQSL